MLVAAASDATRAAATRWFEDAGWRAAALPIDGAIDRLGLQAAASGLWIEVTADATGGTALDRLLDYANGEAAAGRMPAIVAAPTRMIDAVSARLDAPITQVLIDADAVERAAALALARVGLDGPASSTTSPMTRPRGGSSN